MALSSSALFRAQLSTIGKGGGKGIKGISRNEIGELSQDNEIGRDLVEGERDMFAQ